MRDNTIDLFGIIWKVLINETDGNQSSLGHPV